MSRPKGTQGELCVWWIPQVPGKAFEVPVDSVEQAMFLLQSFADYDAFQFTHRIKPDYCNAGGLMVWDDDFAADDPDGDGWSEWEDEDGRDIDEVMKEQP